MALLKVEALSTGFQSRDGFLLAVDGVSLSLEAGEALAIVGESGCGKTLTALSIIGLLPSRARIAAGRIAFDGTDLVALRTQQLEDIRGRQIGMIFQDPLTSLNPAMTIGDQLVQTLRRHLPMTRSEAASRAVELLGEVHIDNPHRRLSDYPHRLSGGMRQRVMIALAVACNPRLLIADEPTTALDVSIQAQILDLLEELRRTHEMAMIVITHDMGVVAETADIVCVMYAGQIVEQAPVRELFARPEHPYTEALLATVPNHEAEDLRTGRLPSIPGRPPALAEMPAGCRFAPRCPYADTGDNCAAVPPPLREIRPGHSVRSAHPRITRQAEKAVS